MAPRYFLAFLTFTSCTVAIESLKYALKGQEVSLKPDITANSADILWKHNGNKVVEFDGRQELVYGQFESRITLDWHSAELTITDLSFEDSGNYDLEIFRDNKLHLFNYKLEVIENVAKPAISCKMNDDGESGTLACSAEPRQPQSLMKFEWSSHGNVLPGPQLIITLGQKHDDEEYSCHVSNPLSNETATFTAKRCYPENGPVAVIAGVVSAVIVLLLIVGIVGVVFCRQTRRACFAEDRTENDSKNQSAPGAAVHDVDVEGQMPRKGQVKDHVKNIELMSRGQTAPKNLQTGSDEETAQGDETAPLLDRTHTLPSTQPLGRVDDMDSEGQMPPTGEVKECVKNIEQNIDELIVPKNLQTGSDKKTAQGDENAPPLDGAPTPPPGRDSLNMNPNDSASNHKEDTGSDLDAGEVNDVDSQDQMPPTGCVKNIEQNIDELIVPKNLQTGSDKKTAQGDETAPLLDGAPTPPPGRGSVNMRPNDSASNHKEDTGSHLDAGKACFAEGTKSDLANQSAPGAADVNDVDSQDQMPRKGWVQKSIKNYEQVSRGQTAPKNLLSGSVKNKCEKKESGPSCRDQNNHAQNSKAYSDADQLGEAAEKEVPYCPNEPDPAGVPTESSTVPRLSELAKKKEETEGAKSRPANAVSPTAQPCSPLTPNSPNTEAKHTAGEHEEDGNSDEISAGKCNSSGVGKANKSDDSSGDEPLSTIPEVKGSETTPHEQDSNLLKDTQQSDDKQQEEDKSVTDAENGTDNVSDAEEAKEEGNPCLASHCDGNSFQESPHTANTDPGQEEENKTRKDSEKEETEGAKSRPANAVSPTAQPCSPLTPNSPNTEAKNTAGEHEEDGSSDEISAGKCNSSGVGKANKSDDSSGDEPLSTIPEEKGSETTPHEQDSNLLKDTQQSDDKQQEEDKSVIPQSIIQQSEKREFKKKQSEVVNTTKEKENGQDQYGQS